MDSLERRVEDILASPMGCAFFAAARELGYLPEDLANPAVSLPLAAEAVNTVERWLPDHERVVAEMLELAPLFRPLVEAALEHVGTAWWYEPLVPHRQVWIAHEAETPDPMGWRRPNSPPSRWERYAQKPLGWQYTTTWYAGHASLLVAYENRSGDFWPKSWPLRCWLMRMPYDVKIYEVNGPGDWHRLCLAYQAQGSDDDRLVPDWGAVAMDWDGVHLSLGGLLSSEQSRYESPEGWSMHWAWHAEKTFWLRALDARCERIADYHGGEDRPAPSGQPQQTFPPYNPPGDAPGIVVLGRYESGDHPLDLEALREETGRGRERRRENDMPGSGPGEAGGDGDARV